MKMLHFFYSTLFCWFWGWYLYFHCGYICIVVLFCRVRPDLERITSEVLAAPCGP